MILCEDKQTKIVSETPYLCSNSAPSRLVILKPKLEDLGLKYTNHQFYNEIVSKNETKEEQDAHIVDISDVKKHHDIENVEYITRDDQNQSIPFEEK
jgi:GTP pyrophosphokinase